MTKLNEHMMLRRLGEAVDAAGDLRHAMRLVQRQAATCGYGALALRAKLLGDAMVDVGAWFGRAKRTLGSEGPR